MVCPATFAQQVSINSKGAEEEDQKLFIETKALTALQTLFAGQSLICLFVHLVCLDVFVCWYPGFGIALAT